MGTSTNGNIGIRTNTPDGMLEIKDPNNTSAFKIGYAGITTLTISVLMLQWCSIVLTQIPTWVHFILEK